MQPYNFTSTLRAQEFSFLLRVNVELHIMFNETFIHHRSSIVKVKVQLSMESRWSKAYSIAISTRLGGDYPHNDLNEIIL